MLTRIFTKCFWGFHRWINCVDIVFFTEKSRVCEKCYKKQYRSSKYE